VNLARRSILTALLSVLAVLAAWPASAGAQDGGLDLRIREAALDDDGATRLVVAVGGTAEGETLPSSAFTVTEQGETIGDTAVTKVLEETTAAPVFVAVVMDMSGSVDGQPLADAKEAASTFVNDATAEGIQVGLYAFDEEATRLVTFTDDADRLVSAIADLEAGSGTALHDAVVTAATDVADRPGLRSIVVFADGQDNASAATLDDALAAAGEANSDIHVAILRGAPSLNEAPLNQLAEETGGISLAVDESAALTGAFAEIGRGIASQYVIEYRGAASDEGELVLGAAVSHAGSEARDEIVVVNNRVAAPGAPEPVRSSAPAFAPSVALAVGTGAAFLSVLMVAGVAIGAAGGNRGRASRLLQRTFDQDVRRERKREKGEAKGGGLTDFSASVVIQRAVELADRLPKPSGYEQALQKKIEHAGWKLRSSELLAIQGLSLVGGALFGFLLSGLLLAAVMGVVAGVFPRVWLAIKGRSRKKRFLEQLPDTLQLLAGSLRAGYGIVQAIDTVAQEASDPTAGEFQRVLTESRLGMPLEDALDGMAERFESEDFRWVVLAIKIQRQVGGNLAELLDTVGATLRERAMVRRQIKTLSAEGKLSAIILTALPFFITAYLFLVNRDYIMLLFSRVIGIAMVVGASLMITAGVFWMRKLIDIEV
jgi:tight adherence protein B